MTGNLIRIDRASQPHRARPREVVEGVAGRAALRAGAAARPPLLGRPPRDRRRRRLQLRVLPRRAQRLAAARHADRRRQARRRAQARRRGASRSRWRSRTRSAERLFDGIAILPRHLLGAAQAEGRLAKAWSLATPPAEMAGLGPFRLKSYVPGERIVLERNPHYWKADKAGRRLPYLDEMVFLVVPNEDAEVLRFKAGETDLISRIGADNFAALEAGQRRRPPRPPGPRSRPRVQLPGLQPEHDRQARGRGRASRPGSGAAPSAAPSPRPSTAAASRGSSTAAGPRRWGRTSPPGTSSG